MGRFLIVAAVAVAGTVAPHAAGIGTPPGQTPQDPQQQTQQPPPQQQTQQPAPPVFRTGVNAVRVDVSVVGSKDLPVSGLQASDFTLTEDGVPQKIDTFQFLRLDGQPRPDDHSSLRIRDRAAGERAAAREDVRAFAILFDDYHVDRHPAITIPMRDALVHFINSLGPTDVVALMEPLTSLSDLEFTRSRPELVAAIRTWEGRQGQIFPVKSPAEEAQLRSGDVARIRAQVSLSALEALVTYLGSLKEGRKTVIFVSQGPHIGTMSDLNQDVERVIRAANRGNVTINTMDPRGLGMTPFGGDDVPYRLAHETGGRAIVNTNNLANGLDDVVADASAYYLLGYVPARDFNDGKFHRIEVKVARRGLHVVARRGYWAPSAAEIAAAQAAAARPMDPGLTGAISSLSETRAMRLVNVWLGWSLGAPGRTHLTVAWEPLLTGTDRQAAAVRIEPVAGEGGQAIAAARTLEKGDVAAFDLDPASAGLHVTALAKDGTTLDEWTQPLTIPNLAAAPLVLATPRFYVAHSPFAFKSIQANADPPPTATRRFAHTDRVLVDLGCYSAPAVDPKVTVELQNRNGAHLVDLPVPALRDGRARIEIPVASLAPADYVLSVRAASGEHSVKQLVAFRVER